MVHKIISNTPPTSENNGEAELRGKIIALGEKGMHRAMLAVYAPQIMQLIAAVKREAEELAMLRGELQFAVMMTTFASGDVKEYGKKQVLRINDELAQLKSRKDTP